jgi:hypothetical protein
MAKDIIRASPVVAHYVILHSFCGGWQKAQQNSVNHEKECNK